MRYRRLDVPVQKDGEGSEGYKKKSPSSRLGSNQGYKITSDADSDSKSWVLNHYTTGTGARVTEQRLYFSVGENPTSSPVGMSSCQRGPFE